jgi:hypothetical protein
VALRGEVVTWTVTLAGGGTIALRTDDLLSYPRFCRACMLALGVRFAPMRPNEWCRLIDDAARPLRGGRP